MHRLLLLFLLVLVSCTAPTHTISYAVHTKPVYQLDPAPQKFLLLNTYNIPAKKFRDNKKELFITFADSLMEWTARNITDKTAIPVQVLPGYTDPAGNTDSTVKKHLKENGATNAFVLESFDVYFEQTGVEVTKNANGSKDRIASYDIAADMRLSLFTKDSLLKELNLHNRYFHSTRSVVSGLLAAGPNVVVQRKDAMNILLKNGFDFLNYFFPGEAMRSRPLFTGKGFEAVNSALAKNDFETALTESMRFLNDPNKEKAAKVAYNCAVLFEKKDQPNEAITYLQESLALFNLVQARLMLNDLLPQN